MRERDPRAPGASFSNTELLAPGGGRMLADAGLEPMPGWGVSGHCRSSTHRHGHARSTTCALGQHGWGRETATVGPGTVMERTGLQSSNLLYCINSPFKSKTPEMP